MNFKYSLPFCHLDFNCLLWLSFQFLLQFLLCKLIPLYFSCGICHKHNWWPHFFIAHFWNISQKMTVKCERIPFGLEFDILSPDQSKICSLCQCPKQYVLEKRWGCAFCLSNIFCERATYLIIFLSVHLDFKLPSSYWLMTMFYVTSRSFSG